jgi:TfoX/Sxy family transcriptional regulator of competence genes
MSTSKETVAYILDQLAPLPVRARAMFGGYGVYYGEKFIAIIGDDTLFLKATAISPELFPGAELAPPYPGAKDHYVIPEDRLEDREWLHELFTRTAEQLPAPKPKASRKAKNASSSPA